MADIGMAEDKCFVGSGRLVGIAHLISSFEDDNSNVSHYFDHTKGARFTSGKKKAHKHLLFGPAALQTNLGMSQNAQKANWAWP